jgi:putative copper resistance protein D
LQPYSPVSFWFAVARASHFASCLLFMSGFVFDRSIASRLREAPEAGRSWDRIFRAILTLTLPASLLTGAWWMAMTAIAMSGLPPHEALAPEALAIVWTQTHFGLVWKLRLAIWGTVAVVTLPLLKKPPVGSRSRAALAWLGLTATAGLSAAMTWIGHAMISPDRSWHLPADLIHIVVGGIWPASLVPFILLLRRLGDPASDAQRKLIAQITLRFSETSLIAVTMMTATGIVNTWYLLGSPSNLLASGYGRTLLWKLAAVAAMVGLGAINRAHLRRAILAPIDEATGAKHCRAVGWLKLNVMFEILLAAAVLLAVGYLGLTPPPGNLPYPG